MRWGLAVFRGAIAGVSGAGALVGACEFTHAVMAGCPAGGVVLDPFGGSGTVGEVAEALGRNWILFDLNPAYAELAEKRTAQRGLFVEVDP